MAEKDYEPVSCDYHDQLEAAATRRAEVALEFERNGVRQRQRGTIRDVFTREGQEFLDLEGGGGKITLRLDEILSFEDLSSPR